MTVIVLAIAFVVAAALISLGFRRRAPASDAPTDSEIIDWSRRFGVEAASTKFSLPTKAVRRLRVVSGDETRTCGSCKHFDLAKGQLAINSHSIMAQVTRALPPSTMGKNPSSTQSWNEFGACLKRPGMIFGSTDWCGLPQHSNIANQPGDLWA